VPKLTPRALNLSNGDRYELQQLIDRHNTPQQIALRAKIILMASDGQNNREIAIRLYINRHTVSLWRNRWLETEGKELLTLQRLQDSERAGAPVKFSMEQVIELFAFACSPPSDYGRPISHWTPRELADEIIKQGITALPAIMQYSFSPCPLLSKLSDLGMYLIAAVSAVLKAYQSATLEDY
jgi:putative transposase